MLIFRRRPLIGIPGTRCLGAGHSAVRFDPARDGDVNWLCARNHVRKGRSMWWRSREFQAALKEFFARSLAESGVDGAAMLVPPPGSASNEYGIIRSFASALERDAFYASPLYRE